MISKYRLKGHARCSGEDKGRARRAQHDQFFYLISIFSMPIMDEKCLFCEEHFNEIIHLLNDIVSKPYPLYIALYFGQPVLRRALPEVARSRQKNYCKIP